MSQASRRPVVLRFAVAAVVLGAAVFMSPNLIQRVYAQTTDPEVCRAECRNGKCSGYKPYCVCSCHWFWGTPVCNCTEPSDQTPTGGVQ
jgi:hypothetical protein